MAFSFSKNMSLYGQRLGLLTFLNIKNKKEIITSNLEKIIRVTLSNAPRYPSDLATQILGDKTLLEKWQQELKTIRKDMLKMRQQLVYKLNLYNIVTANALVEQKGLFSLFSNLDTKKLKKDYAIYIPKNGRINISGIKPNNLDRLAEAISQSLF